MSTLILRLEPSISLKISNILFRRSNCRNCKKNISFINLYDQFKGDNKREVILSNFIYGDIHWNKNGNLKILEGLSKKRIFEEISSFK